MDAQRAQELLATIERERLCIVPPNGQTSEWMVFADFDEIGTGATLIEALEMAVAVIEDTEDVKYMRGTPEQQQLVREWKAAAIADGWTARAMCAPTESIDIAASLTKQGFVAHVLMRDAFGVTHRTEYSIDVWGPDRIAVRVSHPYNWDKLVAELTTCPECKRTGVKTVRVAFANRACEQCKPALRAKLETPGWTS